MKALILAAGRGKRLNEVTDDQNKCMIEVAGKKLLMYSLDTLLELGINEAILVVGYKAEDIINEMGTHYRDIRLKYAIQREQKGLVDAIECAASLLGKEDFLLLLGDEILISDRRKLMKDFYEQSQAFVVCGLVKRVEEKQEFIHRTYTVVMDQNMQISRLIEKPRRILNPWQGTGNCIMTNKILDYIGYCPIHHERKEKELPDLIQCAIDDGMKVYGFDVCDDYTNINSFLDIKYVNNQ